MVPAGVLLLLLFLREAASQDDYSGQIQCYTCEGTAENSTCSDPVDKVNMVKQVCDRGICLKWTKYRGGILQMIRTCSADVDFHLTMIDGVCRTERNGNGFLCMCGKHLCNSATGQHGARFQRAAILASLFLMYSHLMVVALRPT
jgi:hypothetical protein